MSWFRKPKQDVTVKEPAAAYIPMKTPPKIIHYLEGARRDALLVELVQRFGLVTSDLLQQRLSVEQFDGLTSQHNILNRLKTLTERREIYNLGRIASGHIVYAAKPLRGNARRHIAHDLGVARFGITLEVATKELQEWCCDQSILAQEFKSGERPFVPDARFLFNGFQTYLEYHTGSQDERVIVEKMRAYKRHHESLKQLAKIEPTITTKMRVLFVCQREGDVEKIMQIASKWGDSMLWWITHERRYIDNPNGILEVIFQAGNTLHSLQLK